MSKDWTGNGNSVFKTLGASNHSAGERAELDYYATDPAAVVALLEREEFDGPIWEPACGGGHISEQLINCGFRVRSTDIVNRGYFRQNETFDFLEEDRVFYGDIITNPPYKYAAEFVEHALELTTAGSKVAMFLKLTFLEGAKRKTLFDKYPPKTVYVFRNRIDCWKNGIEPVKPSKAVCYAWFVWEYGYTGETVIKWIN